MRGRDHALKTKSQVSYNVNGAAGPCMPNQSQFP